MKANKKILKRCFLSLAIGLGNGLFLLIDLFLLIFWVFKDGLFSTCESSFDCFIENSVSNILLFIPLVIFIILSIIQYKVIKNKDNSHNFKFQLLYSFIILIFTIITYIIIFITIKNIMSLFY